MARVRYWCSIIGFKNVFSDLAIINCIQKKTHCTHCVTRVSESAYNQCSHFCNHIKYAQAIDQWLQHAPLFDRWFAPLIWIHWKKMFAMHVYQSFQCIVDLLVIWSTLEPIEIYDSTPALKECILLKPLLGKFQSEIW